MVNQPLFSHHAILINLNKNNKVVQGESEYSENGRPEKMGAIKAHLDCGLLRCY